MLRTTLAVLLCFASVSALADEQVRKVAQFKSISNTGPVNLLVEAGKPFSVTVQGDSKFVSRVTTEVVNGELRIDMNENSNVTLRKHDRVVVTMPALSGFRAEGAGDTRLNNVQGDRLDVDYRGAGILVINGKVRQLRIDAEGVGEVDTRSLIAQDADVSFQGIGSVSIHAQNKLNANVEGMGSLTYYGNPRIVNKSVSGIGSVTAAR
ncbi:MAG: head GIN domain-containing protein [Telluria sp.]